MGVYWAFFGRSVGLGLAAKATAKWEFTGCFVGLGLAAKATANDSIFIELMVVLVFEMGLLSRKERLGS